MQIRRDADDDRPVSYAWSMWE